MDGVITKASSACCFSPVIRLFHSHGITACSRNETEFLTDFTLFFSKRDEGEGGAASAQGETHPDRKMPAGNLAAAWIERRAPAKLRCVW